MIGRRSASLSDAEEAPDLVILRDVDSILAVFNREGYFLLSLTDFLDAPLSHLPNVIGEISSLILK